MKHLEKHILFVYRLCRKLHLAEINGDSSKLKDISKRIFYKYYSSLLSIFFGAYIPYTSKLGLNIKFNHSFHGVFISENAVIGDGCTILQHVTIGSNQPLSGMAPIIGNNVFIGVGCNIIGAVNIGDNCIVGAGVTIANGIIPNGSIVVGAKYRILSTAGYTI
jgi:serine O-acetyltransferase